VNPPYTDWAVLVGRCANVNGGRGDRDPQDCAILVADVVLSGVHFTVMVIFLDITGGLNG